jgi:hypothetical protein
LGKKGHHKGDGSGWHFSKVLGSGRAQVFIFHSQQGEGGLQEALPAVPGLEQGFDLSFGCILGDDVQLAHGLVE